MSRGADRDVLVVGGGDPATAIAGALEGRVLHAAPEPEDVDDGFVDRLQTDRGTAVEGLDLLVHALYPERSLIPTPIHEMSPQEWRSACDSPLEAAMRLARGAHRHLAARQGTIVLCVPLVGSAGAANLAALAGVAEGSRILARSLARCWGRDGIRCHAVSLHPAMFLPPEHAIAASTALALHDPAIGRLPSIEEVAAVVETLAGTPGSFTGASLVVDGGAWMSG